MKGLYSLKDWFTGVLNPALAFAVRAKVSPNWLTALGVLGASMAAAAFAYVPAGIWLPVLVTVGTVVRLAGANLDGAVSRARMLPATVRGFWINELGDRLSDFVVFAGLAAGMPDAVGVIAVAALAANLPSVASVWGWIKTGVRLNGGPVGKTERCLLEVLASVALALGAGAAPVAWVFASLVIFGSVLTAALRLAQIGRRLAK